jgi:hypothetical protein
MILYAAGNNKLIGRKSAFIYEAEATKPRLKERER